MIRKSEMQEKLELFAVQEKIGAYEKANKTKREILAEFEKIQSDLVFFRDNEIPMLKGQLEQARRP